MYISSIHPPTGEGDIVDEVEVLEKKKSALELLEEAKRFDTAT